MEGALLGPGGLGASAPGGGPGRVVLGLGGLGGLLVAVGSQISIEVGRWVAHQGWGPVLPLSSWPLCTGGGAGGTP